VEISDKPCTIAFFRMGGRVDEGNGLENSPAIFGNR
jgi:hypothetical protein